MTEKKELTEFEKFDGAMTRLKAVSYKELGPSRSTILSK